MADRCTLPLENLLPLPDDISDARAVLIEPLSATCEILEQVPVSGNERIIVLGDGRLGILCAWVLATASADVTLIGHHPEKLEIVGWRGIRCIAAGEKIRGGADMIVEATGSGRGIVTAMNLCRLRGIIVLKSTVAVAEPINLAPAVINEQTLWVPDAAGSKGGLRIMLDLPGHASGRADNGPLPLERVLRLSPGAEKRRQ